MKNKKTPVRTAAPAPARAGAPGSLALYLAAAAALIAFGWAYSPVMHTPFLFDDTKQIFALTSGSESLWSWVRSPVRPLLMATYWFNNQMSHDDTYTYHAINLLIQALSAGMVWLVLRRLAEWSGMEERTRNVLAMFGAALFLLHPAQTESVAYIAGRSESLSGMFAAASLAAFLYRKDKAIGWARVAAVVLLAVAAILSKEQAVVLFAVFLLTDFWWNPGFSLQGIKGNWRLYAPMLAGALGAVALFAKLILGIGTGGSAGFGMKEFTWYQYLFTQFRAIWVYIANFIFPANLNVDWDFGISRGIADKGAIVGLIGLAGLAVAAWMYRQRFRLASYGYFLFLLLLAPTSSILPIKDPVADRRMYLPMIGLILIVMDLAARLKIERRILAGVCVLAAVAAGAATYARAEVWSDPVSLWEDTARKSPGKFRVHFQLGFAYFQEQRFDLAVPEFEKAAAIGPVDYDLLVDLGLAYDGLHQYQQALDTLRRAAAIDSTAHVYSQIGKIYAEQSKWQEAMDAFAQAQRIDPKFAPVYAYQGLVHLATGDAAGAIPFFQQALALDPTLQPARDGLQQAQQLLRRPR
ncbi:MAG: tetratricopeptide repeat protein [Acidobacteria bacterium]|nr:tetratricopeptide repeat protein [Acidobacteriota bacterium]